MFPQNKLCCLCAVCSRELHPPRAVPYVLHPQPSSNDPEDSFCLRKTLCADEVLTVMEQHSEEDTLHLAFFAASPIRLPRGHMDHNSHRVDEKVETNGPASASTTSADASDTRMTSPHPHSRADIVDSDDDVRETRKAVEETVHASSASSQSSSRSCVSSLSFQKVSPPPSPPPPPGNRHEVCEFFEDEPEKPGGRPSKENELSDENYSDDDKAEDNFTTSDADSGTPNQVYFCHRVKGWKELPAILLEDIFVMLSPKQRHQASMVCRPWYETFYSPRVWETFVLWERTLTKKRFNLYKGYQRELCPRKTQICLMRVGCFFKRIIVTPISDYYNLYEFLRVLSSFLTFHTTFPMPLLTTFRFTFACESRGVNGTVIIGTGGNILLKLKDLVTSMQQLRHLALNQLLLEVEEVAGLLAAAAASSAHSLHSLELLNCSKAPVPMCEVSQFSSLVTLKLSPQHLNEEVILLLGGTKLLQLHIVQDAYTCPCGPVTPEAWKLFKDMAPNKRVFLEVQGLTKMPLLLQPHAPVRGVVFRTFYHRLDSELAMWLVEFYGKSLEYFVQECLPRAHGSRKFQERADESFLRLVRECPRLHTLVIRERISLATLLLLGQEGKALRTFTVRRNALIKKCEWPKEQSWSTDFYRWLRTHGRDYDLAFQQMPVVMRQRWKPAIDKVFKHLRVHVT